MERWKIAGAVLLAVAAIGLLFGSVSQSASPEASGLLPASQAQAAPDFALPDAGSGQTVRLSAQARQSPVVISFWATWCGPCREELPHLQALSQTYKGRVQFYGVNASDSPKDIVAFAKENGLTFPMLSDARHTASVLYGVDSIPRLLVVDTRGNLRSVTPGFSPDMDKTLPRVLDALLSERR